MEPKDLVWRQETSADVRSSYHSQLRDIVDDTCSLHINYPYLQIPRIKRDEADVKALMELMENS